MSLLMSLAVIPMDAVIPAAESLAGVARPAAGIGAALGAAVAFLMMFRPLVRGLLRAALLLVSPRVSLTQQKLDNAAAAERLARRYEAIEPGVAAEIRAAIKRDI